MTGRGIIKINYTDHPHDQVDIVLYSVQKLYADSGVHLQ